MLKPRQLWTGIGSASRPVPVDKETSDKNFRDSVAAYVELRRRGLSENDLKKRTPKEAAELGESEFARLKPVSPSVAARRRADANPKTEQELRLERAYEKERLARIKKRVERGEPDPDVNGLENELGDLDIGNEDEVSDYAFRLREAMDEYPGGSAEYEKLEDLFEDLAFSLRDANDGGPDALYSAEEISEMLYGD
jgi:hypothetical protein